MSNPFDAFDSPAPAPRAPRARARIDPDAISRGAAELGIDPIDLATAISYETGGTFDPDQKGPTTKWGQHQGLIQFGEPQRMQYGVRPGMTMAEQMPAVVAFLRDAGVRPGMSMMDVYSAINAGGVGRYNASDAAAGGMPGTVADKVNFQMADHRAKALRIMGGGSGGGGGGGGYPAPAAVNPFDQFDAAPSVTAALDGANPFDEFDAPDFSDVQTTVSSTGIGAPDYSQAFREVEDPSSLGKIGLRALVGRAPSLVANALELPSNVTGAIDAEAPQGSLVRTILDALPGSAISTQAAPVLKNVSDFVRSIGYEDEMQTAGYGVPSVSGGQVLDAVNPLADVPLMDRASRIANFIPETLVGSAPDMAAAVGSLPAYIAARTNEVAESRATNDKRDTPSLADIAIAAPAATAESLLERLTTMRLFPVGTGAAARPGVAAAAGRVAKETGIQGATGAVEEAIPYLAETLGTQAPTTGRGLAESLITGLIAEGALGGGAQGVKEVAAAIPARAQASPPSLADLATTPPTLPAVAAEVPASPRQDVAPAAPPTQPVDTELDALLLRNALLGEAAPPTGPDIGNPITETSAIQSPPPRTPRAGNTPDPVATETGIPVSPRAESQQKPELAENGNLPNLASSTPAGPQADDGPIVEKDYSKPRRRANVVRNAPNGRPLDMLEVIAASGGLNRAAWKAEGVDPAEFTRRAGFNYVFRKDGGMTPDELRELLQQEGYLPRDPEGSTPTVDKNAAVNLFDRAFRGGEKIYSESQGEQVARYKEARRQADDEYRAELAGMQEFAPAQDATQDFDPFADPVVSDFSNRIADLTEQAVTLGATDAEIVGAAFNTRYDEDHIAALENIIQEKINAQPRPKPESAPSNRESSAQPRQEVAAPARAGDFQLQQPAPAEARSEAVAPQGGLFAPPTTREQIAARERAADGERNGLGRDMVPASRGDGELFAGGRPGQTRIDEAAAQQTAIEEPKTVIADSPPKLTSLKNAVTDAERIAEGRDPIIREARKGNRETVDEAVRAIRETPSLGRETAQRLAEGGPVELKDEAVLLVHKVDLRKRRDAAAERAQSPNVSEEARAIARKEYDDLVQQIDEVDQAASRIGTESGRLLQLRRRMIAEDYSLPALERKLRMVVNRDLKPAEQAEIKELADKVATLQHKLDAVESQQASAQVAEMLARLMKQAPGKNATLAERRAAAMESKAALSAMSSARGGQQSVGAAEGTPGQARAALADRLGRGVVARLERAGVLVLDERNGGTWDGQRIGIGNVAPENALGVLLHEVSHANMLDVLGEQGYERALRDLDALEAAGDPLALKAKRRAAKSGETGQRLDDERIAYMVEEATNAAKPAPKVTEFVRSLFSAFRRWAATSAVFRALEKIGAPRPQLKPADFVAFARKGLDRMVKQARKPVGSADADRIRELETALRTDYKTGIRNQRAFDEDADLGWKGVAAMDMDGLKKVNDQLGHDAGDAVLRALANELARAETTGARFYRLSGAGDEFAGRFKAQADADRMMAELQNTLDGLQVEIDVADTEGRTRYFTYQGIGISYGTGADYGTADRAANRQKDERLAAGIREDRGTNGPSRRVVESPAREGGRRASDPPAVGAQRSVPVDVARGLAVETSLPTDAAFQEAVANTNGAAITRDGLEIDLVRFQKEEQSGDTAIRTGVFYLPAGSANIKHYKGGKNGYGGTEKIEGRTLLKRPLFVKGGTGGKAPEAAYDMLLGKGAYQKMRTDALKLLPGYGRQADIGKIEDFLESYGADSRLAYEIVQASKTGNQLPYALQENVVAHAVRDAGYDAVLGYSKGKAGAFISEIFDVREDMNPTADGDYSIHEKFRPQRSIPDQTQTPAFKRWFGDSKVVDASGEPLVVYHGSSAKFEVFDIGKLNSRNEGPGFYFTTSKSIASGYVNREGNSGQMVQAYLSMQKPLPYSAKPFKAPVLKRLVTRIAEIEADADGGDIRDGFLSNFGDTYSSGVSGVAKEAAELLSQDESAVDQISGIVGSGVSAEHVLKAVTEVTGYDGIVSAGFSNEGSTENTIYVAFRPEQIKSATANRGTFDPADPNIMRSIPEGETDAGAPVPAGADPVAFFHLARVGAFHYADGARDLASWTARMESDLGAAAERYRSMLPDAFKAAKAQAARPQGTTETVAEAVEAVGDQRRPRDVKRVVRAVVAEGVRGEDAVISAAAQALDMDDADVRTLFVQSESQARTLTEAQAELKDLRKQLRDAQKPDPETRYQDTRARDFERRIAELEARIAAGDFAKREKVEHDLIERNKRLQFELEKTKERFHRYALEAEFQNRTPIGKIFGNTVAGMNFARAIVTSLDLSAVLRQGGKITLGHPVRALKALPGSLRAFASENADFRIRQEIENRPNAPLYKKFGLDLTSIGGDALSRTEEAYASRWVDKLPTAAGGGLIRGSGRSYTAFLNRLRADSFDAMLAALARDGSNPSKEEGKAIANYINVATGRGKVGKNEKSGEVLNTVFFAPRLVASRFQLLAGQPLYGGSNRTRKMIAMEYARFLIGVSVVIGLAMMMRDEDDETKPIELDPRSANFGKVRFGDTFLDPLAGLAQVTVFLARVASGETRTTTSNKLKPLRDSYRLTDVAPGLGDGYQLGKTGYGGRDVPDVIASFLRSKLAPVPGAVINVATGKNMIGETVTPMSAAGELVTPMSVGNLVDVLEAQGMARGTAINLLGILGMSVQYRKPDAEKLAEEQNGVLGAMGVGTAEDLQ